MADYWKSQPRHFCEFCKCWTADNKPSREFHESGKRHQENVKKKLDELRRKGYEDAKKQKETSSYLEQMEKAALSKLKEDLAADPNMASQYGVVLKSKRKVDDTSDVRRDCDSVQSQETTAGDCSSTPDKQAGDWIEETTPEGYVYYWNTVTRESCWEVPTITEDSTTRDSTASLSNTDDDTKQTVAAEHTAEESPSAKRQKLTSDAKQDNEDIDTVTSGLCSERGAPEASVASTTPSAPEASASSTVHTAPAPVSGRQFAYGSWEEVRHESDEPPVDLQLPQDASKSVEQKTLVISSEPKIKFREKKVTSLTGNTGFCGFRKPKSGIQRSIRTTDKTEES